MEIILTKRVKRKAFKYPTIVKIFGDYYVVSKKFNPEEYCSEKYIAINLNDGKWFDWGDEIPKFEPEMVMFGKGTIFEIEI